jgi:hypothetical protein
MALRFQSSGVNEVVAVGASGATDWPRALKDTQSSYKPPWIATSEGALQSNLASLKGGESLPGQCDCFESGAVGLRAVERSGDPKVHSHYSQGVPIGRHCDARQSQRSRGCFQWIRHNVQRGGICLSEPGDPGQDRRSGRQGPDRVQLHQGRLFIEERHISRVRWTGVIRTGSAVRPGTDKHRRVRPRDPVIGGCSRRPTLRDPHRKSAGLSTQDVLLPSAGSDWRCWPGSASPLTTKGAGSVRDFWAMQSPGY